MNSLSLAARSADASGLRFRDVGQIVATLRTLADDCRRLLEGCRHEERATLSQLLNWLGGREQAVAQAGAALQGDTDSAALVGDWLAHAPSAECRFDGHHRSLPMLLSSSSGLEAYLVLLFGMLMQHSDGPWVRALYQDLLDHPVPLHAATGLR